MREVRRFTEREDAYIKENCGGIAASTIARHLGRSPASVVSRQVTLGLRTPNRTVSRFRPDEDRAIRDGAGKISMYEVARRLGRAPSACYQRAATLGISFDPAKRSAADRRLKDGYWWIPIVVDGKRRWRQEHRLVMEHHIGRPLTPKERVHHVNLDGRDNAIGNLFLCRSDAAHRAIYGRLERLLGSGRVVQRLLELGILSFNPDGGDYFLCETSK